MSARAAIIFVLIYWASSVTGHAAEPATIPPPSLEAIADNVWIHKSYEIMTPGGRPVLSQGLVIKTDGGVFLIDTAWNDSDTVALLDLIEATLGEAPAYVVGTHGHNDKMGGMAAINEARIASYALDFANKDAKARGLTLAANDYASPFRETSPVLAQGNVEGEVTVFYPGPGHTRGNLVVYYAPAKVLFGGCLIRPGGADNLGNTADGDVGAWAQTVRAVAARFPEAEVVIPSHGPPAGRELLDHTIALAEAARAE